MMADEDARFKWLFLNDDLVREIRPLMYEKADPPWTGSDVWLPHHAVERCRLHYSEKGATISDCEDQ